MVERKSIAMMLLNANATITICHSRTEGLPPLLRQADIVIAQTVTAAEQFMP